MVEELKPHCKTERGCKETEGVAGTSLSCDAVPGLHYRPLFTGTRCLRSWPNGCKGALANRLVTSIEDTAQPIIKRFNGQQERDRQAVSWDGSEPLHR